MADRRRAKRSTEERRTRAVLKGATVYDAMVATKSPWLSASGALTSGSSKDKSIAVSQFINSLVPLQSAPKSLELSPEEWARVIDGYWEAIERVLPAPFERRNSRATGCCSRRPA